jgi:hypothetical protein
MEDFMDTMKQKVVKTCFITATFPNLPVPKATVQGRGEGGTIKVAAANAMKDVLKHPNLRGRKNIAAAKMVVAFGFRVIDPTETQTN